MPFFFLVLAVFALVSALVLRLLFALGAPYVPSSKKRIHAVLELAGDMRGKRIVDLGAGDGRVVIACAKAGAQAHGYEINPLLARQAMKSIAKAGLDDRAHMHWKSYWNINAGEYDIVVIYGISTIMQALEKKLRHEIQDGAKVISVYFTFPTWTKTRSIGDVHLYERTSARA